jgi:thiamine biosynthesis lipoprotein
VRIALPPLIAPVAVYPGLPVVTLGGETMGTRWQVRAAMPRGQAAAVEAAIVGRLAGLVAEMSHWLPDSLLRRFNRAAAGSWHALPPDFAEVMATGLRIAAASEDAFDPAIGALVDLWGFGPVAADLPPAEPALAAAMARSGWRRLRFDAAARRLWQPGGVALDLSGIAKGYAVDAVADLLARAGVGNALVEIGGELVGRGIRPDGDPWWVDLENPPGCALPPLRVALHGLAVATSGDYRRGEHTIDPRIGRPCGNGVASISVLHARAVEADAWASALSVLGPERGMALAAALGLAARMVIRRGKGVEERLSPALAAMLAD